MMKKTIIALAAVLMLGTVSTTAFAAGITATYDENGITVTYPEEMAPEKLAGILIEQAYGTEQGMGEMEYFYFAISDDEYDALSNQEEEPSEEEMMELASKEANILSVVSFDGGRTAEEGLADLGLDDADPSDFVEVGKAGDITFYAYINPAVTEKFVENVDKKYADEFKSLQKSLLEALKNAEYTKPVDHNQELVGKKVSFETTDIDGNTVKSSELFGEHKLTMVNIWETGCGACVGELSGLNEVKERAAEKDAALITICLDADTKGDLCKELLQENGAEYRTLLPFNGIDDTFPVKAIPTSFFVDSEGTIVAAPTVGAPADMGYYVDAIDSVLSGEKTETAEKTSPDMDNKEGAYRVFVKDTNGDPVKDATVQFCSDDACMLGTTDENGMASFDMPEGIYTVHILKAPDGYESSEEEYKTQETFSDVTIVLQQL